MASEHVLDASAFYAGTAFLSGKKCATTSAVFEEVSHIKSSHAALEALMDAGNLSIVDPDGENIDAGLQADINRLYPADEATGFRQGDIRGAFSVVKYHTE